MTTEIAEVKETPQAIKEEDPKIEQVDSSTNSVPPITLESQKTEENSKDETTIPTKPQPVHFLPKLDLSATEDISSITSPPQSPQIPSSPSPDPEPVTEPSTKPAQANSRPKRANKETVKLKKSKESDKKAKKKKTKENIKKGDEVIVLWDDGKRYMATIDEIIPNSPDFEGGLAYTVIFSNGDVFDVSSDQVFANDDEVRVSIKKRKQASEKKTEKKPEKKLKEKEKPDKKKKKKKKQKRYDSDSEDTEVETETSEPEIITTNTLQHIQQQPFIMHPSVQYAQFANYTIDAKPVHIPIAIAEPVIPSANTVPASTTTYKIAIGGQSSNNKFLSINYKTPLVIPANTVTQLFGNPKKAVNAIVMKQ